MKKVLSSIVLSVLLTVLAACGQASTATSAGSDAAGTSTTALTLEMQLLVGTLKLEDTELAVTADEAVQLLPLWRAILGLESSGTAASEEIEAVVDQIQATMNADQIAAITDLGLTRQDEISVMGSLGLSTNFSSSASGAADSTPAAPGGQDLPSDSGMSGVVPGSSGLPSGGAPSGGMPSAGTQGSSDSNISQSQIATLQAQGTQTLGSIEQVPQSLLEALITILQTKAPS
jgi:hypothetical protein